jgi:AP-1 complex subunit mu
MPELRLGLNDKVIINHQSNTPGQSISSGSGGKSMEMEVVKFHQCIRLSRFENDRTISFIPPDGEFELNIISIEHTSKTIDLGRLQNSQLFIVSY